MSDTTPPQPVSPDQPAKRSVDEALREAWLGALGVLSTAESEIHRFGDRLRVAAFGDESLAADVMARVRHSREQLEHRVDTGVRQTLANMIAPINQEIAHLRDRMERLSASIDDEAQRRAARRAERVTAEAAREGESGPGQEEVETEPGIAADAVPPRGDGPPKQ